MAERGTLVTGVSRRAGIGFAVAQRLGEAGTSNPGPTDTGWATPEIEAEVQRAMPSGRWGQPDDAARLIAWLASEDAAWVTAQVIDSDGGFRYGGG